MNLVWLDTLILDISVDDVQKCRLLLADLHFPRLSLFATKFLPHEGIAEFLRFHPNVQTLSVGPCGATQCPIPALLHIKDISSPSDCIPAIVSGGDPQAIFATLPLTADNHHRLFTETALPLGSLTTLTLNFIPGRDQILAVIRDFAPTLQNLRLIEKSSGQHPVLIFINLFPSMFIFLVGSYVSMGSSWGLVFGPPGTSIPTPLAYPNEFYPGFTRGQSPRWAPPHWVLDFNKITAPHWPWRCHHPLLVRQS